MQPALKQGIDEIYCQLIPLRQLRLIVPRSCLAEVIRYAPPERSSPAPEWFRGLVQWTTLKVPVLSFEELCGRSAGVPGGRTRIAIFNAISGKLDTGYYGVLTEGFPQLVRVNREVIRLDDRQPWPPDGPVVCQIRMINEYPLIPDLERVEELLHRCLEGRGRQLT
ncbi:MAG: chemotaxis protein CheW [Gammaproteobacteria bacterium]|jgi:chemosensory pili system protein ChpC|nr:chemotaxis protein CheW [Gammaproteobacteria bacterium]